MKNRRRLKLVVIFILIIYSFTGCWNYREVNNISVVAGIAIDKNDIDGRYEVTVEVVNIKKGKDMEINSEYLSLTGNSLFDIIRNMISISSKRLYFSHAKVIIISEDLAREGLSKVVDWYIRDAETRPDINLLISKKNTAKEIIMAKKSDSTIVSFELRKVIENEKNVSTAPKVDLWDFLNALKEKGVDKALPLVFLEKDNEKVIPKIEGMAVMKKDKLIGTIDGEISKYLLLAMDEIHSGILVLDKDTPNPISFEIFKNNAKKKYELKNGKMKIQIFIDTTVSVAENQSNQTFFKDADKRELEERISNNINDKVYKSIRRIQNEYKSDILGFGIKLHENNPKVWNELSNYWDNTFENLEVEVVSNIKIKNSAVISKPIEIGE